MWRGSPPERSDLLRLRLSSPLRQANGFQHSLNSSEEPAPKTGPPVVKAPAHGDRAAGSRGSPVTPFVRHSDKCGPVWLVFLFPFLPRYSLSSYPDCRTAGKSFRWYPGRGFEFLPWAG
ncbi:hypothetical protein AAFF_G00424830 [Aldrovandia affinis]|uniref:Uncharacterized protein n=1 Tax=Aldrovandia affinis TaxID=143900 RepID=A0AAD7T7X4_9TELE|nr:hypothetical protein AAFF_G00424830 [Aldrovandia affinis]